MTTQPEDLRSRPATSTGGGDQPPDAPNRAEPPRVRPRRRRRWFRYTLPGAGGALLFTCLAFTPSLLPRGPVVQGLVCGISAAIGYGVGVVAAWAWRAFADRDERPARPKAWRIFAVVAQRRAEPVGVAGLGTG